MVIFIFVLVPEISRINIEGNQTLTMVEIYLTLLVTTTKAEQTITIVYQDLYTVEGDK